MNKQSQIQWQTSIWNHAQPQRNASWDRMKHHEVRKNVRKPGNAKRRQGRGATEHRWGGGTRCEYCGRRSGVPQAVSALWPSDSTPRKMYPEEIHARSSQETCAKAFVAAHLVTAKPWKQLRYPRSAKWENACKRRQHRSENWMKYSHSLAVLAV